MIEDPYYGLLDLLIAYETGNATRDETLDLFQRLVDTGLAWSLPGRIGRTARDLIASGYISEGEQ